MHSTIRDQIRDRWEESGLTQCDLIALARLKLRQGSLSRKLSGRIALTTDEAEALATALRCEIRFTPKSKGGKR